MNIFQSSHAFHFEVMPLISHSISLCFLQYWHPMRYCKYSCTSYYYIDSSSRTRFFSYSDVYSKQCLSWCILSTLYLLINKLFEKIIWRYLYKSWQLDIKHWEKEWNSQLSASNIPLLRKLWQIITTIWRKKWQPDS